MTPADTANQNVALMMTIVAIAGALAYAGWWLLTSEHRLAIRFRGIMSRLHIISDNDSSVAEPLPEPPEAARQPIAKPGNAVNEQLPGNALPEEAREIVRFWANVEAVEAVVKTGKIGQVEAIEAIFRCKRSGRPDSPYGRAHAAVAARLAPAAKYRAYTEAEKAVLQTNGHDGHDT